MLDAKEKYDTALNFYKHAEYGQTQKAGKEWEAAKDAENMILGERLGVMMQRVSQQLYEIEQQLISTKKISSVQAKMLLKMARHTVAEIIENEEIELHDRIPLVARPWSSLIAPAASKSLSQHKVELEKWDDLVHQVVKNWNDRNEDVENALDLALAVPGGHSIAYEYIRRVQSARVIAVSNAAVANDNAIKESLSLRADSVSKLKSKWNEIITRVEKEIEPAVDMLRTAGLTLKSELQKNGME